MVNGRGERFVVRVWPVSCPNHLSIAYYRPVSPSLSRPSAYSIDPNRKKRENRSRIICRVCEKVKKNFEMKFVEKARLYHGLARWNPGLSGKQTRDARQYESKYKCEYSHLFYAILVDVNNNSFWFYNKCREITVSKLYFIDNNTLIEMTIFFKRVLKNVIILRLKVNSIL